MARELGTTSRRIVMAAGGALLFGLLAFVVWAATGFGGATADTVFLVWVYDGLMLGAAAACLLRARLVAEERLAWAMLGIALAVWTAGEIYYAAALSERAAIPIPSPADAGYLLFYPLAYAGLILLVRRRVGSFSAARWLDGVIAGAALAALVAALAMGPIVDASTQADDTLAVATNLAYPIGDLTLLALVATAAALDGWRLDRRWMVLAAGLVVLAVSDSVYLLQTADGTYVEGGLLDVAWPLGALLIGAAAWLKPRRPRRRLTEDVPGLRQILIPAAGALVAVGVQAAERFTTVPPVASFLSLLTLLAVVVRMALSFRDNQAHLMQSTHEALTDPLTGLGNRRSLIAALDEAVSRRRRPGELCLMVVFDLDGFKAYNDAYGHPAGDALLRRLGDRLSAFIGDRGGGFRFGGDEFCVVVECGETEVDGLVAGATASLREHGDGFVVSAARGSVLIPVEARTREGAMQLADRRMYRNKSRERASAGTQSTDVLLTALREREPRLHEHLCEVADLALAVADELEVDAEERDEIYRAAELHDIGKMAIPDAILSKAGPLDQKEWEFMHEHTLIGERIVAAAPALGPIARLVRSSHERWDGKGYPDGLAGEAIPLGARIICACDAFDAMTSERPYSAAIPPAQALEEIHRGAGTQFDPRVASALGRVVERLLALAAEQGGALSPPAADGAPR